MKLTEEEFLAIAFTFEKRIGHEKDEFENELIEQNSHLSTLESLDLEEMIISGLESDLYQTNEERIRAYWTLSKAFNKDLIPDFQKWLRKQSEQNNPGEVYQILIALSNLDEKVFTRMETAFYDEELNLADARNYLIKISNGL
jgi:hypothetical protein